MNLIEAYKKAIDGDYIKLSGQDSRIKYKVTYDIITDLKLVNDVVFPDFIHDLYMAEIESDEWEVHSSNDREWNIEISNVNLKKDIRKNLSNTDYYILTAETTWSPDELNELIFESDFIFTLNIKPKSKVKIIK